MDRTQPGLMNNQPPPADAQALWRHFSETYFSLRFGLAVLAFAFPAFLYFWGRFVHDLPLQPSMSAYFFAARASAETGAAQCAEFPMRTFFVGGLCAIAAGLHLYKGLTRRENTLLNTAAICALLVAVYPERITGKDLSGDDRVMQLVKDCPAVLDWAGRQPDLPIHFAAAAALFVVATPFVEHITWDFGRQAWAACHACCLQPAVPCQQPLHQRTPQLIREARSPPLGFQDRHATVALANHDLRSVDLGWNGDAFDPDAARVGPSGRIPVRRCQRMKGNRSTAARRQQQQHADHCDFQRKRHGACSRGHLRGGPCRSRGAALSGRPRISDSG